MYSEQQIDIILNKIVSTKGEYDDICPEIKLLSKGYYKVYIKVINKVKEKLKLIALNEDRYIKNYIKDKFGNCENIKFDEIVLKENFYHEEAFYLYINLCEIAYNNMERLIEENNILEENK